MTEISKKIPNEKPKEPQVKVGICPKCKGWVRIGAWDRMNKKLRNEFSLEAIEHNLAVWTKKAGIEKHVTTHTARHSFSNEARRKGVDLYDISKMLGHSSLKTTQIYMEDFDQEEIDKAQDKIYE